MFHKVYQGVAQPGARLMVGRHALGWLILFSGCLLPLSGCEHGESAPEGAPPAAAGPAPPAPEVEVVSAVKEQIREYRDYTGRTAAANSVQIRARVSGYLKQAPESQVADVSSPDIPEGDPKVQVSEGEFVEKGTLLFQVDPEPYQLALQQAKGNLAAAQAQLKRFELELARTKELFQSNSISRSDYDLAVANQSETLGQIENLQAAVNRAELDLQYTQVVAPIDGLLGRSLVTPGNLITADSTQLTTVVSAAPIYVYFDVDERSVLSYRERMRTGDVPSARTQGIAVQLGLASDKGFPHEGYIDFVNNQTDPSTGNTQLRATFPNEDSQLSVGLFARIRIPFSSEHEAILVPTKSIGTDQQGKYVMVVEDGKAQRRTVMPGLVRGEMSVIAEGLTGTETVIVSGLQKVRPGSPVRTVQAGAKAAPAPTAEQQTPPAEGQSEAATPSQDEGAAQ